MSKELLEDTLERVETLISERKGINDTIKYILTAAEGQGLDKRTIREMLRLRGIDKEVRDEQEALRELYLTTLGI